jgi:TonB-dependent SusC/RagA subfamily outer membrane receptor
MGISHITLVPLVAPYLVLPHEQVPVIHWSYVAMEMDTIYVTYNDKMDYLDMLWMFAGFVYFVGVLVVLSRMIYGIFKIIKYHQSGVRETKNGYNIVTTEGVHLPFSFFKSIYISRHIPLSDHMHTILEHEEIHIRHWHTVDVLFAEVVHAFFWFNPVMIFYKRALRQAHEYLADDIICSKNSVSSYAGLIAQQIRVGFRIGVTNQFFHSQIKKRIEMMTKHKTNRHAAWKYALVLPLLMGLVVVFFSSSSIKKDLKNVLTIKKDTIPPLEPSISNLKSDALPANVKSIHIRDNKVDVKLKSGKTEVYKLDNLKDKTLFETKYGNLPSAPPPPPAPESPALPPAPPAPPTPPAPKSPSGKITGADLQAPLSPLAPQSPTGHLSAPIAPTPPKPPLPPSNGISLSNDEADPLFVIDGIKKTKAELNKVDPNEIETVNVLKGASAVALYGDEGKNGVVQVITKKNSNKNTLNHLESATSEEIFNEVEEMPRFPGCENITNNSERDICAQNKLLEYVFNNLKYPKDAREKGIEGKCIAEFMIDKKGIITDIKLIKDIGSGCGEELIRVIKSMNQMKERWIPARQNGKIVNVKYTLPVKFAI